MVAAEHFFYDVIVIEASENYGRFDCAGFFNVWLEYLYAARLYHFRFA